MIFVIQTARDQHGVHDLEQWREAQRQHVARRQRAGIRAAVHDSPAPLHAYVNLGRWVCDCECGAGNATDPDWGLALCFDCGAMHPVIFPRADERAEIERLLLARPLSRNRNWIPGESIAELAADNLVHDVRC